MNDTPKEEVEQRMVVNYLRMKGHKFTAIPNSTYTKSWSQKRKNKDQGLNPGFPDLVAIVNGRFIAIEMKRVKGGVVSEHQKEWILDLNAARVQARVCKGAEEAINFIRSLES